MKQIISIGDVTLPIRDFAVARTAILGITKSGKTYTAKGIAEQLYEVKVPFIVFDAIGVWKFLKVAGNRGKGFKVVVAGGEQGDLPLSPQSAPEIVRAAIRENISLVIDLYDRRLSKKQWRDIVRECFRTLLYENKGVRTIILEETPEYAPQRIIDGETYAEVEKVARMGGNQGLGLILIAQRSQEVNKALLELCDNVVLMRQRGSNAIDALEKWMDRVDSATATSIAKALPHMQAGDAWVWTEDAEKPVRTHTNKIQSFHPDRRDRESATVKAKPMVDTEDFVERLTSVLPKIIEEKRQNDPASLRREIDVLKRQIEIQSKQIGPTKEIEIISAPILKALDESATVVGEMWNEIRDDLQRFRDAKELHDLFQVMADIREKIRCVTGQPKAHTMTAVNQRVPKFTMRPTPIQATNGNTEVIGKGQMILNAIAELEQLGSNSPKRPLVSFLVGYTNTMSKGFTNAMSTLSTAGLIHYPSSGTVALTDAGRQEANPPDKPRTSDELQARIINLLGGKSAQILQPLIESYPTPMERVEVAERAGYGNIMSKGFTNALSRLSSLGFVHYPGSKQVAASPILFLQ